MKIVNFLSLVILVVIGVSCDDTYNNHDQLVIGTEEGMEITYYDTIITGTYNVPNELVIDIDDNGSFDFLISCESWGSPAVGAHPKSFIKPLNTDFQLYGDYTNDSVFLNITVNPNPNAYYTMIRNHQYNCYQVDEFDSLCSITSTFKTTPLVNGTIIKTDHFYASTQSQLIDVSYSLPPQNYSESNDTIVGLVNSYNRECDNFPIGAVVYIGFKDKNRSKLGWIKCIYLNANQFMLLETAIQN